MTIDFDLTAKLSLNVYGNPAAGAGNRVVNLVKNQDGRTGAWGWLSPVAGSAVDRALPGLQMVTTAGGAVYFTSEFVGVPATHVRWGYRHTATATTPGVSAKARIEFYDADYLPLAPSAQLAATAGAGAFAASGVVAKPAGAVYAKYRYDLYRGAGNPIAGDSASFDSVYLVNGTAAGIADPLVFDSGIVNILGAANELTIARPALDLGILTATLYDVALDPAVSATIRAGKRIELVCEDISETLFEGEIQQAKVAYDYLNPDAAKLAQITLTAVDPLNPLGNVKRSDSVGSIDELRGLLEGAGIPWNVNGSYGHLTTPYVAVTTNEGASIVDQIVLARDSALGYAWVSREGVLNVWDAATMLGDADLGASWPDDLDESVYGTDLEVDFDTTTCINYVTVKLQRLNPDSDEPEELTFGPYTDETSRNKWGTYAREFTVVGHDETTIPALAEAILTANAEPVRRVLGASIPIRTAFEMADWAAIDLYQLLDVTNTVAGIAEQLRVTEVTHSIVATNAGGEWTIGLGFESEGGVAMPQQVPSPGGSSATTLAELLRPVGEVSMFYGTALQVPASWLELNGATFDPVAYPKLFTHLGTNVLPDWNDRVVMGASGSKAVGSAGGSPTRTLTASNIPRRTAATAFGNAGALATPSTTGTLEAATAFDILPPYRAIRLMIRAR